MDSKIITIEIYSDIACPWCYIGEKKFSLAKSTYLSLNPTHSFKIILSPYMIDPNTNKLGEDYLSYNKRRWGGDGWTDSLRKAGKKVGCFFADWQIWPNTFLAHCLITYAGEESSIKAVDVLKEIFELCYEKGENVSEMKVLEKIAKKYKLDEKWKEKEMQTKVLEADAHAKNKMNIHGVPYFVINEKYSLEGAVDSQTFQKYFNK